MLENCADQEIKQWGLVPDGYMLYCSCCGSKETACFESVAKCIEAFKSVGFELRRTGVWCPDCVKEEKKRFAEIDEVYGRKSCKV